jgi:hypothetical protein
MKRITLITLTLLTFFTFSCKKDKNVRIDNDFYISANKDNVAWISKFQNNTTMPSNNGLSLAGASQFPNCYYSTPSSNELLLIGNAGEEHLRINFTASNPNQYQLDKTKTKFIITVGQDVVVANYVLDEGKSNIANITNINTSNYIVSGNFMLHFKKASGHESYPTTIVFTDGKFRLKLNN